jgi:hypothetical protein
MTTISFLEKICQLKNVIIYQNDYVRNRRSIYFYGKKCKLIIDIIANINAGKKLYFPTNSNKHATELFELLKERCPNYTGALYNRDTIMDIECDPILIWKDYDYVIATPKMQAGNSFVHDHFDKTYCYFSGASCSPEAACQLMSRVRNLKENEIHMYLDNRIGDKQVFHDVNTFEEMQEKVSNHEEIFRKSHKFVLSTTDMVAFKLNMKGKLDLNDPSTFLMMAAKYNNNEGYKDYTKRMICLMKGMGYSYGGNLAEETNMQNEECKCVEQKMVVISNMIQTNRAQVIVDAPFINTKEILEIERRLYNQDTTLTMGERYSLLKYNMHQELNLLDWSNSENIILAEKIIKPKKLVSQLVGTCLTFGTRNMEISNLEYALNSIAEIKPFNLPSKAEKRFYELKSAQKALVIGYLLSSIRILGFRNFFDVLDSSITNVEKLKLIEYLNINRKQIEDLLQVNFTDYQLSTKGIIKWLNGKLEPLLLVKVKDVSRNNQYPKYALESPWRIVTDGNDARILHHPLETNVSYEDYVINYPETMRQLIELKPMYPIPDRFEACYHHNTQYLGGINIINISAWNRYLKENENNVEFQHKARELYDKYLLLKGYEDHLLKNSSLGKECKTWLDYKESIQSKKEAIINKRLTLNIVKQ